MDRWPAVRIHESLVYQWTRLSRHPILLASLDTQRWLFIILCYRGFSDYKGFVWPAISDSSNVLSRDIPLTRVCSRIKNLVSLFSIVADTWMERPDVT